MSGGHFDHQQYAMNHIADEIERVIGLNDSQEKDKYGDFLGHGYPVAVIREFKTAVGLLRRAAVYAQRVDWLLSADDGPENFLKRLKQELERLERETKSDV